MSSYEDRRLAAQAANTHVIQFIFGVFASYGAFIAGQVRPHGHHIMNPWFCYGASVVSLGLALLCLVMAISAYHKSRY